MKEGQLLHTSALLVWAVAPNCNARIAVYLSIFQWFISDLWTEYIAILQRHPRSCRSDIKCSSTPHLPPQERNWHILRR
jgi:hypothetical protein